MGNVAFPYKMAQFENVLTGNQIDLYSDSTIEVYLPGSRGCRLQDENYILENILNEITSSFSLLDRFDGKQVLGDPTTPIKKHYRMAYVSKDVSKACEIEVYDFWKGFPSVDLRNEGAYDALPPEAQRKVDLYFINVRLFEMLQLIEKVTQEGTTIAEDGEKLFQEDAQKRAEIRKSLGMSN